jgi:cation diffusion facilitator family transporter
MRLEKQATVVSTTIAGILVLLKMSIGILSGSIAVLASAVDSFLDLIVSAFNYFALNSAEKDPDNMFHYGRGKLEPLAAVMEGVIISISALFILYEALQKIVHPQALEYVSDSIIVMVLSFLITLGLVVFLNYVANKTQNMVIKADALHYKTDLFSNGAVLITLILISSYSNLSFIDPFLGLIISIYMIYSAYPIIKDGILMLLDIALPNEKIQQIIDVILKTEQVTNYHFLQTREAGSNIFISVHIVFNLDISLYEAHSIADNIEQNIKNIFSEDKKVDVLIHMDPYDDSI